MVERARAFAKITQKTGCLLALRDSLQCQSLLLREFCGTSTKGFGGFFERGAAVLRVQTLTAVGEDQSARKPMAARKKHWPKVSPEVVAWEDEPDWETRQRTVPVASPEFQIAVSKYPQCEVQRNHEIVRRGMSNRPGFELPSKAEFVRGRWENPICHNCRDKPNDPREKSDVTLKTCTGVPPGVVLRQGEECQRADWVKRHKQWCTNLPNVTEVDPDCPYELRVATMTWRQEDRQAFLDGKLKEIPTEMVLYPPED